MTFYRYFTGGSSWIVGLDPLPGVSNNFIRKIALKHFSFTIYLRYQLKNTKNINFFRNVWNIMKKPKRVLIWGQSQSQSQIVFCQNGVLDPLPKNTGIELGLVPADWLPKFWCWGAPWDFSSIWPVRPWLVPTHIWVFSLPNMTWY
jgi:hypothetical protein